MELKKVLKLLAVILLAVVTLVLFPFIGILALYCLPVILLIFLVKYVFWDNQGVFKPNIDSEKIWAQTVSLAPILGNWLKNIAAAAALAVTLVIAIYFGCIGFLKQQRTKTYLSNAENLIETYRRTNSRTPQTLEEIYRKNPLAKNEFSDSWGREFVYIKSAYDKYQLSSVGADGVANTNDDITNALK